MLAVVEEVVECGRMIEWILKLLRDVVLTHADMMMDAVVSLPQHGGSAAKEGFALAALRPICCCVVNRLDVGGPALSSITKL